MANGGFDFRTFSKGEALQLQSARLAPGWPRPELPDLGTNPTVYLERFSLDFAPSAIFAQTLTRISGPSTGSRGGRNLTSENDPVRALGKVSRRVFKSPEDALEEA